MKAALGPSTAELVLRDVVCAGRVGHLRVSGGCLAPAVADGERVRLASPDARPARFGDIVLARVPAGLRLHRLIWPLPGLPMLDVRTKADRAPFLDPAIPRAAILATVIGVERGSSVVPTRSVVRAARSLTVAVFVRLGVALGWRPA